jgi:hypothetical protein
MNYPLAVFEFELSPSVIIVVHQKNAFPDNFRNRPLILLWKAVNTAAEPGFNFVMLEPF